MRRKERESGKKSMRKALRVFINTNVLLSGLLFSGNEHRILKSAQQGKLKLVISQDVIEKAEAVIRRKFSEATEEDPQNPEDEEINHAYGTYKHTIGKMK